MFCFDPLRLRYSEDQIVSSLINRSLLNLALSLTGDKMSRGHLVNVQVRAAVSPRSSSETLHFKTTVWALRCTHIYT